MAEAEAAFQRGEVPVGAVVSDRDGRIVAADGNRTRELADPTAHAELLAIRQACRLAGSERLTGHDLHVTLEPCTMCAAAISFARIRRLYFGAGDPKMGAVEHGARVFHLATCHHAPEVYGGIGEEPAAALLLRFFDQRRGPKTSRLPDRIVHCDWSKDHKKRWMAIADLKGSTWQISRLERVGDTIDLIGALAPEQGHHLLLGFDFPIGLPSAYGRRTGFANFREALASFGTGQWSRWFDVAETSQDISHYRPFYPRGVEGKRRMHLTEALGVADFDTLLRVCERKSDRRAAACALFWTLGGNQVGKAAITGWIEVIKPILVRQDVGLWPFDGSLHDLLQIKRHVIAETYPADAYVELGLPRKSGWSKRKVADRRMLGPYLLKWLETKGVEASPDVVCGIRDGLGSDSNGEDRFDAVVGLLGMIGVVNELPGESAPADPAIRNWEGWILGQPS